MNTELQRIKPTGTQVFNGVEISYGVAPILSALSDISMRSNRPMWNLFLINIETLIRDRDKDVKNKKPEDVARAVLVDCSVMAQYIATYCRVTLPRYVKTTPIVCFYLPHYELIPAVYLREKFKKGTEERWCIRSEIEKILSKEKWNDNYENTEIIFCSVGSKDNWPHAELFKDLANFTDNIQYRSVLMISHAPSDFHLYRKFKDFRILESFTGNLKEPKEFGKKVFKDENIPFNKYTHLLLGDEWYLKSQLDTTGKKEFKKISESRRWKIKPEKDILADIASLIKIDSKLYTKPNI